jgi:tetratricopeptide (TPR) repeat protein
MSMRKGGAKRNESELTRLAQSINANHFDQALRRLSAIEEERPLHPSELVLRGRCIQLSSGQGTPGLEAAEKAFQEAIEIDAEYIPALLELAWFYHAVDDDPARALLFFEKAIDLSSRDLTEAISGKTDCLTELQTEEVAEDFLKSAIREAVRVEKLSEDQQSWVKGH